MGEAIINMISLELTMPELADTHHVLEIFGFWRITKKCPDVQQ